MRVQQQASSAVDSAAGTRPQQQQELWVAGAVRILVAVVVAATSETDCRWLARNKLQNQSAPTCTVAMTLASESFVRDRRHHRQRMDCCPLQRYQSLLLDCWNQPQTQCCCCWDLSTLNLNDTPINHIMLFLSQCIKIQTEYTLFSRQIFKTSS